MQKVTHQDKAAHRLGMGSVFIRTLFDTASQGTDQPGPDFSGIIHPCMTPQDNLLKILLTHLGKDPESLWAVDLGPAESGPPGSRKVRLDNVPFLHAKPTWGDVIVVSPSPGGLLTWDRGRTSWKNISKRILEDGGRWVIILDYLPHGGAGEEEAFSSLAQACQELEVVCEGAFGTEGSRTGRTYLAVPRGTLKELLLQRLQAAVGLARLTLVHPR
jgi:hypothetical protein